MEWHSVSQLGQHKRETREGYVVYHDVVIARTGTQIYHEHEIPPLVGDSGGRVHVAREPEDVFDEASVRSFDGKPIVDDHPNEMVGPDNWSDLAIGYLANPRRGKRPNDDVLLADLIFTTRKGIARVSKGKRALSVGYTAEYQQDSPGTGRQHAIFCNHLALVDEGRCGSRCVILDGQPIWSEDTVQPIPATRTTRRWFNLRVFTGDYLAFGTRFRERVRVRDEFNEADHPRDEEGKFTEAGGGGAGGGGGGGAKKSETFSKSKPPPHELHGVPFHHWSGHASNAAWEHEAKQGQHFDEPEFKPTPGKKTGAGVIIQEPDGRVWIVHPTNGFGGYDATFPKGGVEADMTQKGTALKEAFEESGLKVELTGFAGDVERSTSKARYYYAKRVGGTPAAHGWESSGVTLAPVEDLKTHLNHPVDHEMVDTLLTGIEGKQAAPTPVAQQANAAGLAPPAVANWKKIGGKLGSNNAAQMEDETGAKHYVKFQQSDEHAKNEVLASRLYAAAGSEALQPKLVDVGDGKLGTATKWQEGVKLIDHNSASEVAAAQENFATHAWLANWDAPGLSFDNQGVINGQMHTLDVGGSLLFRAQGGPKGAAFGYEANEWDTLRQPNNAQAHKLFGGMTDEQLKDSAKRVAIIPDETIKAMVMEHGPGDQIAKAALANKLIARKQDIMAQVKAHIAEGGDPTDTVKAIKAYASAKVNSDYARHANALLAHLEQHHGLAKGELGKAMAKGATAPPPEPKAKAAPAPAPEPTPAAAVEPVKASEPTPPPPTPEPPAAHDPSVMPEPASGNLAQEFHHNYAETHPDSTAEKIEYLKKEAVYSAHPENKAYAEALVAHLEHKHAAEQAAAPVGEFPKADESFSSQKKLQAQIQSHKGTTAEKIAVVEKAMGNYVTAGNKAYAEKVLAHLKGQQAAEPEPSAPAAAADPATPPKPEADNMAQEYLHADLLNHTGTKAEKLAMIEKHSSVWANPDNKAYAASLKAHVEAQPEPEATAQPEAEPDHLKALFSGQPDITATLPGYEHGNPVHEYLQGVMHNPNLDDGEKIAKAQTEYALSKAPENKAYAKQMVEHFGGEITPDDEAYAQHIQSLSAPESEHATMPKPDGTNLSQEALHEEIVNHTGTTTEKIAHAESAKNGWKGAANIAYANAVIAHLKSLPEAAEPAAGGPNAPEAGNSAQEYLHEIATHPNMTTAEKISEAKKSHAELGHPDNIAYAEHIIQHLGGSVAPEASAEPAATGHTFHTPPGLPAKPYGWKAGNILAAASTEGTSLAEKIKAVQALSGEGINNYKQGVIKALKAANTPLPKPAAGKKAQAHLLKAVQNETTLQGKLDVLNNNAGHWTLPANIAYKEALSEAVHKQHSATPGGGAATPATTPAPKPAPPPGPVAGPDPAPNSNKQKEVHEIANHPTDTHEVKIAKITSIANIANPGGTTQAYANTYLKAMGAPEVSAPAPYNPYAPTPQVSGTPNAPKPSTTHVISPNKMKTARAQKLHAGAAKVSSGEDPQAAKALPSMDRKWWSKIPAAARAAVKSYKGGSSAINGQLRGDSGSWSQHTQHEIDHLDELFEHPENVLQQDVILRRGEGVDQKVIDKHMADLAKGGIVRPHRTGFTSTSMASKAAFGSKNVIYEIIAKKGTQAVGMWANDPSFHSENEVLLRHGTSFEVYEIEKVGNQYIYRCHTL
jgi:8-oxo-dGTP pyrophosphatase MutT (NUDIX family)